MEELPAFRARYRPPVSVRKIPFPGPPRWRGRSRGFAFAKLSPLVRSGEGRFSASRAVFRRTTLPTSRYRRNRLPTNSASSSRTWRARSSTRKASLFLERERLKRLSGASSTASTSSAIRCPALLTTSLPAAGASASSGTALPTGGHRVDRVLAGKEPDLRPRRRPPVAQQFEQLRREHHVAIPLPLALLDPKRHALAVDLQVRDLGHPQARAVGDAERGLVLQAGRGFEQTRHLLLAQHDRRPTRFVHGRQRENEVGPFERHGEEKPQRGDGGVDRPWADLLPRHMQFKAAKVLLRRRIWRPAEEGRKHSHIPNVVPLGVFGEPARRHVVDHALTQRADGLVGHRESSCLAWGCEPHDFETGSGPCVGPGFSTSRSYLSPPLPRERFS